MYKRQAYDLVHFLVIDWQAGIARAAHAVEGRAGRFGVLGHDHIDARLHDFAHRHVGQIEDVYKRQGYGRRNGWAASPL